jgi:predicted CoA-binding protein
VASTGEVVETGFMPDSAEASRLLRSARSVLVIDWPSREVPVSLARAGYEVIVRGGPGPADYSVYAAAGDQVTARPAGRAPEHVDLVYCHRPVEELPGIAAMARELGARGVWRQSGLSAEGVSDPAGCWVAPHEARQARAIADSAGLAYLDAPYIVDALRQLD